MKACKFVLLFNEFVKQETIKNEIDPHKSALARLQLLGEIPPEALATIVKGFTYLHQLEGLRLFVCVFRYKSLRR